MRELVPAVMRGLFFVSLLPGGRPGFLFSLGSAPVGSVVFGGSEVVPNRSVAGIRSGRVGDLTAIAVGLSLELFLSRSVITGPRRNEAGKRSYELSWWLFLSDLWFDLC